MMKSNSNSVLDEMRAAPIVPTVFPLAADILCNYARVLSEEGYPCLELLSRPLDRAIQTFREIRTRPERRLVHWGIGTILTERAAQQAAELRPDFLVSPAFSQRVLKIASEAGIPYIPGVHSFQDVQDALEAFEEQGLKLKLLKLCPIYGLTSEYVAALCGCYPGILFCPTGEVTLENYREWKQMPGIAAPMGSRFIPQGALERGDFAEVRSRLRDFRLLAGSPSLPSASRPQKSAKALVTSSRRKQKTPNKPVARLIPSATPISNSWSTSKPS